MSLDKLKDDVKAEAEAALADAKKTSHNFWVWVAFAGGAMAGFGAHWLFF